MKPVTFDYAAAHDVPAALALLGQAPGAKLISGGQSLGAMLNLRLARPPALVDISRLADLRGARDEGDSILYGAAITHAEIEDGLVPDATPGWLAAIARRIAYRAVRNRGTLGGSLAHADPAADWVNVMSALGAEIVLGGRHETRRVPLPEFFTAPFTTLLRADELILGVRLRKRSSTARWGYWKHCLKRGDFAKASAAVLIDAERSETRVLLGAIERPPVLLESPAALLDGAQPLAEAVKAAAPHLGEESHTLHVAALRRAIAIAKGSGERT